MFIKILQMLLLLTLPMAIAEDSDSWEVRSKSLGGDLTIVEIMKVSDDGYVYLLSYTDKVVMILDPQGKKIGVLESQGDGPGEFRLPYRMQYLPKSESLVVADAIKRKILTFKKTGEFVTERPMLRNQMNGEFLSETLVAFNNSSFRVDKANQGLTVYMHDISSGLGEADSWKVLKHYDAEAHPDAQKLPNSNNFIRFPWMSQVLMTSTPDQKYLYVGSTRSVDFSVVEVASGKVVSRVVANVPKVPLLDDEVNDWLSENSRDLRSKYTSDQFKKLDFKAAFSRIFTDSQGRLWLEMNGAWKATETQYLVFSQDGKKVGRLTLPSSFNVAYANENSIWGFENTVKDIAVKKTAYKLLPY